MKDNYIADLARMEDNQSIESHYLVLSKQQRTTRNAKPYLSLILGDNSGQIESRVWDPADTRIAVDFSKGDVIKVRALVSKFEGVLQLKIERLRKLAATEFDRTDLLPSLSSTPSTSPGLVSPTAATTTTTTGPMRSPIATPPVRTTAICSGSILPASLRLSPES